MTDAQLRARTRAAIKKEGLTALAKRLGIMPPTLQRFAFGVGATHSGTVALVRQRLETR